MLRGVASVMLLEEAETLSVEEVKQALKQSVVSQEMLGQIRQGMVLEMSEGWWRLEPGYWEQ